MKKNLVLSCLVVCLGCVWGLSQELTKAPAQPIEITKIASLPNSDIGKVKLQVKNTSSKEIAAYGLVIRYKDENGKPLMKHTSLVTKAVAPTDQGIRAGEITTHTLKMPVDQQTAKPPASYEITLDYVAFKDGSSWGPNEMHMSSTYSQLKAGAAFQRAKQQSQTTKN